MSIKLKLPDEPIRAVAAVSGGADSMTMLYLLAEARMHGKLQAVLCAHYNHGLRQTAGRDEAHVQKACKTLDIPFVSERGQTAERAGQSGQSIEMAGREARYAFLSRVAEENCFTHILTAHTADDTLETVLLNLIRGTGLSGLCGIPYRNGLLLRPLLHACREEIMDHIQTHEISYVTDESNSDRAYRRNILRHEIIPRLLELNPALIRTAAEMTQHLREDEDVLDAMARDAIAEYGKLEPDSVTFPAKVLLELPKPVAFRVLRTLLWRIASPGAGQVHYAALLALCRPGQKGKRADLPGAYIARRTGTLLIIERQHEI